MQFKENARHNFVTELQLLAKMKHPFICHYNTCYKKKCNSKNFSVCM